MATPPAQKPIDLEAAKKKAAADDAKKRAAIIAMSAKNQATLKRLPKARQEALLGMSADERAKALAEHMKQMGPGAPGAPMDPFETGAPPKPRKAGRRTYWQ